MQYKVSSTDKKSWVGCGSNLWRSPRHTRRPSNQLPRSSYTWIYYRMVPEVSLNPTVYIVFQSSSVINSIINLKEVHLHRTQLLNDWFRSNIDDRIELW